MRNVVLGLILAFGLACGGVVAADGEGSAGGGGPVTAKAPLSPFATSLVEYYQQQAPEVPLLGYHLGDEIPWGDFTLRYDAVAYGDPWMKEPVSGEELGSLRRGDREVLLLTLSTHNRTPIRQGNGFYAYVLTPDGEDNNWVQGHRTVYAEMTGLPESDGSDFAPSTWSTRVQAALVKKGGHDSAALYIWKEERQYDPTDPSGRRKIDVTILHAVVDLGSPPYIGQLAPPG